MCSIFVTHSGSTNDLVSVWDVSDPGDPTPVLVKTVQVGLNPFGLDYVPTTCATSMII